ncbi:MAG: helix-turn-helix transcriptional regulator [Caulobacteraceae bacterium]|nr:helix-turn-helix transcriptional regulator [Caulobacteraceae bacterium]
MSNRQMECLTLIAAGQTSASIARTLGISRRTVDHYIGLLCGKLGVRTRAQAVGVAVARGIIPPPDSLASF